MSRAGDDAKLIFGTVFSLRNMARKLGGDDDAFISYRTAHYKLHFYETPASLRFVMLTDTATMSMRNVLHQIYINLWVEYGTFRGREEDCGEREWVADRWDSGQEPPRARRAQGRRRRQERALRDGPRPVRPRPHVNADCAFRRTHITDIHRADRARTVSSSPLMHREYY